METPEITGCKDVAFARNLAKSMSEGYGRWNSNLSFRPGNLGTHMAEFRYAATPMRDAMLPIIHVRENQQARVIGRIGDNALRERWHDCEIGDAVPESKMHIDNRYKHSDFKFIEHRFGVAGRSETTWMFERVCFRVRSDGDCMWHEEYLWKRIA